ncbi:MAG: universal stress protein [Bacteroidales bacterium]|jgi:nucleotide-binding universal stress UspA family protein|nr:universal stress protein [Bacteroidales bacterium]
MQEDQINNVIVVTWDFTHISEYALTYALKIATIMHYEVKLFHIVEQGTPPEILEKKRKRMSDVCTDAFKKSGIVCKVVVKEGSLYSAVSNYANQSNTQLVVMGTHGIKGMQKLFGSKALKVISGSNTPFIVVQSKPDKSSRISNVVFPIDFKSENKEKLQWAIYVGRNFYSKIHLFKYPVSDSDLQRKVNVNLNFAIRFLKQNGIEYEIHTSKKSSNFAGETIRFAEHINADLIIVTTTKHITLLDYMFGADEQEIIANSAKIPVMCMNPMIRYSSGASHYLYG